MSYCCIFCGQSIESADIHLIVEVEAIQGRGAACRACVESAPHFLRDAYNPNQLMLNLGLQCLRPPAEQIVLPLREVSDPGSGLYPGPNVY